MYDIAMHAKEKKVVNAMIRSLTPMRRQKLCGSQTSLHFAGGDTGDTGSASQRPASSFEIRRVHISLGIQPGMWAGGRSGGRRERWRIRSWCWWWL
jgi:hypothetical protein